MFSEEQKNHFEPQTINHLEHAVKKDTRDPDTCYELGIAMNKQNRPREALKYFHQVIRMNPGHGRAFFNMGIIFKNLNQYDQAIVCYEKALKIHPHSTNILFNLANALLDQGNTQKAIQTYEQVLGITPEDVEALNYMGTAYSRQGHEQVALKCHMKALDTRPDHPPTLKCLGDLYKKQKDYDQAVSYYQKAVQLNPQNPNAYIDLGGAFYQQNDMQKAISCCKKAICFNPDNADAHYNLGITLEGLGHYENALAEYNETLRIDPEYIDAVWNRSLLYLLKGNFDAGWRDYESRIHTQDWKNAFPHLEQLPRWDGASFKGKRLYIQDEQGMGDTIQFLRYIPMVKKLGGEIVFKTKKPLLDLISTFDGIDSLGIISREKERHLSSDLYAPILSLARIFRTTLQTIPENGPYLTAPGEKIEKWCKELTRPGLNMGLVWAGNPNHKKDHLRSCKLNQFAPLTKIGGINWYGIQKGDAAEQAKVFHEHNFVTNFNGRLETFADTAGLIANLDLIISVDTAVAHLAGAMGKPVWVILPFSPDWRWMLDRDDSPWYPTMRLFRQPRHGDWDSVIHELQRALIHRMDNHG